MTVTQIAMIGILVGYLLRETLDYVYNVTSKYDKNKRIKIVLRGDVTFALVWFIIWSFISFL